MAHVRSFSPYALHNSVFEKTEAKKALRLRDRFLNDKSPPNGESAVALLERVSSVYHAVRLEHGYHKAKNVKRGRKRPYGGKVGKPRMTPPASVPAPAQMSKMAAAIHKLHREDWTISGPIVVSEERVAAGYKAEIAIIATRLGVDVPPAEEDGISTAQTPAPQATVAEEPARVLRSLSPRDRFKVLDAYHDINADAAPPVEKAAPLLKEYRAWRQDQSWHACDMLNHLENDLKRTALFSPADLEEIGKHYKLDTLPEYPECRHINTLTARIAIAMEACKSVGGTSPIIAIDQDLAAAVAAKYNAFLAKNAVRARRHKRTPPVSNCFR